MHIFQTARTAPCISPRDGVSETVVREESLADVERLHALEDRFSRLTATVVGEGVMALFDTVQDCSVALVDPPVEGEVGCTRPSCNGPDAESPFCFVFEAGLASFGLSLFRINS